MTAALRFESLDDEMWWKACGRKRTYASERDARTWLRSPDGMVAYHCRYGDHWHIGHDRDAEPEEEPVLLIVNRPAPAVPYFALSRKLRQPPRDPQPRRGLPSRKKAKWQRQQ